MPEEFGGNIYACYRASHMHSMTMAAQYKFYCIDQCMKWPTTTHVKQNQKRAHKYNANENATNTSTNTKIQPTVKHNIHFFIFLRSLVSLVKQVSWWWCKQESVCPARILVVTVVTGTVTEPRQQELVTPRVRFSLSPTGRPYFRDLGRCLARSVHPAHINLFSDLT